MPLTEILFLGSGFLFGDQKARERLMVSSTDIRPVTRYNLFLLKY
jgi:hypothetical protein